MEPSIQFDPGRCMLVLGPQIAASSLVHNNDRELGPAAVEPALDALADEGTKAALFKDAKIYIEACITRHHIGNINTVMLVTDDYAFFKVFAHHRLLRIIDQMLILGSNLEK